MSDEPQPDPPDGHSNRRIMLFAVVLALVVLSFAAISISVVAFGP